MIRVAQCGSLGCIVSLRGREFIAMRAAKSEGGGSWVQRGIWMAPGRSRHASERRSRWVLRSTWDCGVVSADRVNWAGGWGLVFRIALADRIEKHG